MPVKEAHEDILHRLELLQGVINILEAILEVGLGDCVRFFEASSCEIFGKSQVHSCDEEAAMRPQTPYGKAKLLAHLAVMHYRYCSPMCRRCCAACEELSRSLLRSALSAACASSRLFPHLA